METPEELEFTQEEQELRSLRGVLGEPRKSRNSYQASFVLGGLLCLVGAGAFLAVDKFLPEPVDVADATPPETKRPKVTDPAMSDDSNNAPDPIDSEAVAVATATTANQQKTEENQQIETASADAAPGIATPGLADGEARGDGALPSVERSIESAELAAAGGIGPEIGTNPQSSTDAASQFGAANPDGPAAPGQIAALSADPSGSGAAALSPSVVGADLSRASSPSTPAVSGGGVQLALSSPKSADALQNLSAEPGNPNISSSGARPIAPGPASSVALPQIASLSISGDGNASGAADSDLLKSAPSLLQAAPGLPAAPANPRIASLDLSPAATAPESAVPQAAARSEQAFLGQSAPKSIASAQVLGAEPVTPFVLDARGRPVAQGTGNNAGPTQIASLSPQGQSGALDSQGASELTGAGAVKSLPKLIGATQALPPEPGNPQVGALGVDQFSLGRASAIESPQVPSRRTSDAQPADGADPAAIAKSLPMSIGSARPLPAEPRNPQIAALDLRPADFGLASGAGALRAGSASLAQNPRHKDVSVVAALGAGSNGAAIVDALTSPSASLGAGGAAPTLPGVSEIAAYDSGSTSTDTTTAVFFPKSAAEALVAEPSAPKYPQFAALDVDLGMMRAAADLKAPSSVFGALQSDLAHRENIGAIEVASFSEATPELLGSAIAAPHGVSADGAAETAIAALLVGYDLAAAPTPKASSGGTSVVTTGPATPNGARPPTELVQLASATPAGFTFSEVPKEYAQTALSATLGVVNIGAEPARPADAQPASEAPVLEQLLGSPPADRRRELMIASISLGGPHVFDVETGSDTAVIDAYMIGEAPEFDLPTTPDVTPDPAAAIAEPLDTAPPASDAPAPVVLASLGAQPRSSLESARAPSELTPDHQEDAGRDAAREAVLAAIQGTGESGLRVVDYEDTRPAWVRNGVAPPANPKGLPVLAIVIDEVGDYGAEVQDVRSMSRMVTVSVIPSTPNAASIAKTLRASQREVLVHMPMEANSSDADLGPRPILNAMSDVQVQETAQWHLSQFDGYIGVNSHRGGAATEDSRVMKVVMEEVAKEGGLFLDSRNSSNSVAEKAAREADLLAAGNNVFIDEKRHTSAIHRQLDAAVEQAKKNGGAIAIGNPHVVTVQSVKSWMRKHDGQKVVVAPLTHVAQVMNGARGDDIIIAGTPPEAPKVVVNYSDAAETLKESASEGIRGTLSGIAAKIGQSLFNR